MGWLIDVCIVMPQPCIEYSLTVEYAEITESPGAGHYRRRDSEVGTGLKRSLSARHREGIHAGYPNSLIAPVDTLGQSKNNSC